MTNGARHFDFLIGSWLVQHRRLKVRLQGSTDWEEFAGTATCISILQGAGNFDQIQLPWMGSTGCTLRLFDPRRKEWSLYWASSRDGLLLPPVIGRFQDGVGTFEGEDQHEGQPVRVRYIWSEISPVSARWEQAFSADGGSSWESNWIMKFTRSALSAGM